MRQRWKSELEKVWRDLAVPALLRDIGVDFEESFLTPLRDCPLEISPYINHQWSILRLTRLPPGVLHASPIDKVGDASVLWEEWFIECSDNHHHALRNQATPPPNIPAEQSLLHWRSPINDTEHPKEIMDVDWHYFNDADQRPYLLR